MNLSELEALFYRAVRGRVAPDTLDDVFVSRPGRSGAAGMRVYNGAYFVRLTDALADSFPVTSSLLGEPRFRALSRRYVMRFPSRSPALERVGAQFPDLLAAELSDDERDLVDVARLEWGRLSALLAPPDEVLRTLSASCPETLHVSFVRSLFFVTVTRNSFRLFQTPQREPGTAPTGHVRVAFWRQGFQTHHRTLDELEWRVLGDASDGIALTALCARLTADCPDPVSAALDLLGRWLRDGWIARSDAELPHAPGEST